MLEISIHRDYNKVLDYKKLNKSINLNGVAGLLLVGPTKETVQQAINNADKILENYKTNFSGLPEGINTEFLGQSKELTGFQKLCENVDFIVEMLKTVKDFIKNIIWTLAHPIQSLFALMQLIAPFMILFASITPIIGLMLLLFDVPKLWKWHTKELIINPIIIYFIYLVLTMLLKSLI